MPLLIVQDDIVNRKVDCVVNAANEDLLPGGGVCGAIFAAAGYEQLDAACKAIGHCPTGSAVITPGFRLAAHYIVHAVGPVWRGGDHGEAELLRSAYLSALKLAVDNSCESIAFPLISAGIYGVPRDIALSTAREAFEEFLDKHDLDIELVLFQRSDINVGRLLDTSIRRYISSRLVGESGEPSLTLNCESCEKPEDVSDELRGNVAHRYDAVESMQVPDMQPKRQTRKRGLSSFLPSGRQRDLDDVVHDASETFSEMLIRLIDDRGLTDPEVYRKANIDRKLFSKIRSDAAYSPSKRTVLALAIALELSYDETCDLLARAGFAFSPSSVGDLIVRYFIEQGDYDIFRINEALFAYDQPLLCA